MKTIKVALIALMVTGLGLATVNAQDAGTTTPAKTKAAPKAQHLKKDGTPDMRYKENKQAASGTEKSSTKTAKPASTETKSTKGTAAKSTTKTSTKKSAGAKAGAAK